jgi:hypothetical protein
MNTAADHAPARHMIQASNYSEDSPATAAIIRLPASLIKLVFISSLPLCPSMITADLTSCVTRSYRYHNLSISRHWQLRTIFSVPPREIILSSLYLNPASFAVCARLSSVFIFPKSSNPKWYNFPATSFWFLAAFCPRAQFGALCAHFAARLARLTHTLTTLWRALRTLARALVLSLFCYLAPKNAIRQFWPTKRALAPCHKIEKWKIL